MISLHSLLQLPLTFFYFAAADSHIAASIGVGLVR